MSWLIFLPIAFHCWTSSILFNWFLLPLLYWPSHHYYYRLWINSQDDLVRHSMNLLLPILSIPLTKRIRFLRTASVGNSFKLWWDPRPFHWICFFHILCSTMKCCFLNCSISWEKSAKFNIGIPHRSLVLWHSFELWIFSYRKAYIS